MASKRSGKKMEWISFVSQQRNEEKYILKGKSDVFFQVFSLSNSSLVSLFKAALEWTPLAESSHFFAFKTRNINILKPINIHHVYFHFSDKLFLLNTRQNYFVINATLMVK